jgi:hypothetical protein
MALDADSDTDTDTDTDTEADPISPIPLFLHTKHGSKEIIMTKRSGGVRG